METFDPVTSDQNLKILRKLYNNMEANTQSLKAFGVEQQTYGAMLASVLLGKQPLDFRLIVGCKMADAELSLQEVVEEDLTAEERTITPNQSQPRLHNEKSPCSTTTTLLMMLILTLRVSFFKAIGSGI